MQDDGEMGSSEVRKGLPTESIVFGFWYWETGVLDRVFVRVESVHASCGILR